MHIKQSLFDGYELRHNAGFNAAMNIGLDAGICSFKVQDFRGFT